MTNKRGDSVPSLESLGRTTPLTDDDLASAARHVRRHALGPADEATLLEALGLENVA